MTPPVTKGRVLVVDDDGTTARTFGQILALEGYEVRTAAGADAALREMFAWRADAFVLDMHMPFINGLGLLYRLRTHEYHMPVAIVTGDHNLDDEVLQEISNLGAELHFKPLWLEDLVRLVARLVEAGAQAERPVSVGSHIAAAGGR